ncbi:AraC family transcriptional regulator [Mameliella sp.]|uniref:AraC family transcriptional regulator n=1 Tax=Mameliella sp. TaxID=1924940 RepID=UPI003BAA091D
MPGNFDPSALRQLQPFHRMLLFPRGPLRLYVMPTSVGCELKRDETYDYPGLTRGPGEFVLFQYTLSGCGRLTFEGRDLRVPQGRAMLLRMPHDHRYYLPRGEAWEFFWICISGREAVRIWTAIIAAHGPLVEPGDRVVDRIAEIVRTLSDTGIASPAQCSALAYEVCMSLAEEFLEQGSAVRRRRRVDAVRGVIDHARANLDRPLSIDEMAAIAGYSRSHFTRVFEQSEGISPARFMLELRLREALAQLQSGGKTVKQIAFDCGFRDPSYFAKTFRRVYGIAPSDLSDGILASSLETKPFDE